MSRSVGEMTADITMDELFALTASTPRSTRFRGMSRSSSGACGTTLPVRRQMIVDAFGNIAATRYGADRESSLMIAAHSDEIGCLVKSIEGRYGSDRSHRRGGDVAGRAAPRVRGLAGVIGNKAGHISTPEGTHRAAHP